MKIVPKFTKNAAKSDLSTERGPSPPSCRSSLAAFLVNFGTFFIFFAKLNQPGIWPALRARSMLASVLPTSFHQHVMHKISAILSINALQQPPIERPMQAAESRTWACGAQRRSMLYTPFGAVLANDWQKRNSAPC